MNKVKTFCHGLKIEFQKIIWPSVDDAFKQFLAVVVITAILGCIIVFLDLGIQYFVDFIVSLGGAA